MRSVALTVGLFLAIGQAASAAQTPEVAPSRARHRMSVTLDPVTHRLSVDDELTLPAGVPAEFLLNDRLRLTKSEPPVVEVPLGETETFFGINAGETSAGGVKLKRYRAAGSPTTLKVSYEGAFDLGLGDQKEEYTRGFRETAGLLNEKGVYLAGSGFWYPQVGRDLIEFSVEVTQPEGWQVISQGNGTARGADGRARWESHGAMDEIYLVGGPLRVSRDSAGAIETLAYLHDKDDALAGKYLEATAQYIEMYRGLIGPYPYGKFALVENFWETGYGMPSFTLLGPQIIRFPFILTSSYPHEILHNWWGNSVFVDYETGNWSEGLTSYLADFMIQEQRGKGAEYRQSVLQKYRDFVKDGRDFPLSEFKSRHSASTEAIGYGKTMMGFHMLRREIGDDAFRKFLQRFYREYRGKRASFRDVEKAMEAASGKDLKRFFDEWAMRAGAPTLAIANAAATRTATGFEVSATLRQTQPGSPFSARIPILVRTNKGAKIETVSLDAASSTFKLSLPADHEPLTIDVDPEFDVFRKLDPRETPTSIGQIFGESRVLALLPSKATAAQQKAYRDLVESWRSDAQAIDVRLDNEMTTLPKDRAVWLLGRENLFATSIFSAHLKADARDIRIDGESMALAGHSLVLTERHPSNLEKAVGWIVSEPLPAMPGLGRKLPHYGKYSYLGFEGEEPVNVLKGQWAGSDSPLHVDLRTKPAQGVALPPFSFPARTALAELPPVFSQKGLMDHVNALTAPTMEGRGLGTKGIDLAARYIADQFTAIGLLPGGDNGTYFQKFTVEKGPQGAPVETVNVIALLPGTKPGWKTQSAILSAHYDHLGLGWPDVRKGDEGKIHPGADDNASGVSVMIELARALKSSGEPSRTVAFIAFSGEEAGLKGSAYYVDHPALPLDQIIGVINLDTVGRLGADKITVLGTGTATEWQHIFRGAGFVTGVESRIIPETMQSSDQMSFIGKNVPAIQLFTALNADYHRPSDTADKIDAAGLVKVAAFAREGIAYLAERDTPLTNTIKPVPSPDLAQPRPGSPAAVQAQGRRVSFGAVPDFEFTGMGVRASDVVADSPAAKAGMRSGDVLVKLDATVISNLQGFSDFLKTAKAGQVVAVNLLRDGKPITLNVTLVER
ncbi:MAG: M20/M25/M40 family metallo-hydrolase [Vicinamibacteria bacterium]